LPMAVNNLFVVQNRYSFGLSVTTPHLRGEVGKLWFII
jgi:hypothetical protein